MSHTCYESQTLNGAQFLYPNLFLSSKHSSADQSNYEKRAAAFNITQSEAMTLMGDSSTAKSYEVSHEA